MTERFQKQTTNRGRDPGTGGLPSMSQRQLDAYLLTRETLRRIRRTSTLFDDGRPARPPGSTHRLP